MDAGAAEWDAEERRAWVWAYLAGLPVQLPEKTHGPGQCRHCDALRRLVAQANELLDTLTTQYVTPN
jgi:hypothetical protein